MSSGTNPEDEYFARIDAENKAKLKARLDADGEVASKRERKAMHWNKCGKCGADMRTEAFRGVEIELCPECGAVLLDPGELQKLAGKDNSGLFASMFSMFSDPKKS